MLEGLDSQMLVKIAEYHEALATVFREAASKGDREALATRSAVPGATAVSVPKSGGAPWLRQHIIDLVAIMEGSPKPIGGAWSCLNQCADNPEAWFSFAQVHDGNENSGDRRVQTQADLGALTKYIEEVRGTKDWPMETMLIGGVRHYRCGAQISRWIDEALRALGKRRP